MTDPAPFVKSGSESNIEVLDIFRSGGNHWLWRLYRPKSKIDVLTVFLS
jgi:hypothetical protein